MSITQFVGAVIVSILIATFTCFHSVFTTMKNRITDYLTKKRHNQWRCSNGVDCALDVRRLNQETIAYFDRLTDFNQ